VGVSVATFLIARSFGNSWVATLILLGLAAVSLLIYEKILNRVNQLALERREMLVAELCRA
jgi:hypothetical protein